MIDPISLLAMANGAVAAIRKGCELYKEYKAVGQEVHEVATDIGKQLGGFFKAADAIEDIAEEQKEQAKKGGKDTLNQQALDRVLAQRRIQQMEVELRETLIYHSPPELGAIYTDFLKAREEIKEEQAAYKREEEKRRKAAEKKKREFWNKWNIRIAISIAVLVALEIGGLFYLVHLDYMKRKEENAKFIVYSWRAVDQRLTKTIGILSGQGR